MTTNQRCYTGVPGFNVDNLPTPSNPAPDHSLIDNHEFLTDCARYLEGLYTRAQVKKRWRNIDDATWDLLGDDNELVDAIELERTRRIRNGSCKREKAQQLIVKGPEILDSIATNPKASDKHKIDAVKALDGLTGNLAEAAQQDRIVIRIDMGADIRANGGTPNPADVLVFEASPRPIDATPPQEQLPPPRRGPGRPPGSKNKPNELQQRNDDGE